MEEGNVAALSCGDAISPASGWARPPRSLLLARASPGIKALAHVAWQVEQVGALAALRPCRYSEG